MAREDLRDLPEMDLLMDVSLSLCLRVLLSQTSEQGANLMAEAMLCCVERNHSDEWYGIHHYANRMIDEVLPLFMTCIYLHAQSNLPLLREAIKTHLPARFFHISQSPPVYSSLNFGTSRSFGGAAPSFNNVISRIRCSSRSFLLRRETNMGLCIGHLFLRRQWG